MEFIEKGKNIFYAIEKFNNDDLIELKEKIINNNYAFLQGFTIRLKDQSIISLEMLITAPIEKKISDLHLIKTYKQKILKTQILNKVTKIFPIVQINDIEKIEPQYADTNIKFENIQDLNPPTYLNCIAFRYCIDCRKSTNKTINDFVTHKNIIFSNNDNNHFNFQN